MQSIVVCYYSFLKLAFIQNENGIRSIKKDLLFVRHVQLSDI